MKVDITGADKGAVLAALRNAARSTPAGSSQPGAHTPVMHPDDARKITDRATAAGIPLRFETLWGRVLRVDITDDLFEAEGYDAYNGDGAARRAIYGAGLPG